MSLPKSCCETTCICFSLLLLVCAISFLAISLSPASSPLVIFTSRPCTEVANLPSVEIDSCGDLLTHYSITLLVSSHRERLQVDVAWPWYGNECLPWDLRQRYCVLNLRHLLGFLLLYDFGFPNSRRQYSKKSWTFRPTLNIFLCCQTILGKPKFFTTPSLANPPLFLFLHDNCSLDCLHQNH